MFTCEKVVRDFFWGGGGGSYHTLDYAVHKGKKEATQCSLGSAGEGIQGTWPSLLKERHQWLCVWGFTPPQCARSASPQLQTPKTGSLRGNGCPACARCVPGAWHPNQCSGHLSQCVTPVIPSLGCPFNNCKSTSHSCMIARCGGEGV